MPSSTARLIFPSSALLMLHSFAVFFFPLVVLAELRPPPIFFPPRPIFPDSFRPFGRWNVFLPLFSRQMLVASFFCPPAPRTDPRLQRDGDVFFPPGRCGPSLDAATHSLSQERCPDLFSIHFFPDPLNPSRSVFVCRNTTPPLLRNIVFPLVFLFFFF